MTALRIYAVADIHGREDRMARIRSVIAAERPDVLVAAGDITSYTGADRIIALLNDMPVPVLAVRGNTDLARVEDLFARHPNISPLNLTGIAVNGVPFAGLSGTIPVPFRSRIGIMEAKKLAGLASLVTPGTVVVVHTPPRGILDEAFGRFHAGSKGLAKMVRDARPLAVICGHIHECPGVGRLGDSLVVNCNMGGGKGGALIDIEDGRRVTVRMLSNFPS